MERKPHYTDMVVGRNIRIRRLAKEMSQATLGDRLKVTFQQVQKYEKGTNRVGASRLMEIAEILGVPVHAFFEGAGSEANEGDPLLQFISDPQALRLARAFAGIDDTRLRRSIVELVEGLAGSKGGSGRK